MANRHGKKTRKFTIAIAMFISILLAASGVFIIKKFIDDSHTTPQVSNVSNTGVKPENTPPPKAAEITPSPDVNKDNETKDINVVLSSVGDCTIGTDPKFNRSTSLPVIVQKNNNDPSYLFSNVASIFKNDDITTANLETTFTTSNNIRDKNAAVQYSFKGDPELAKSLSLASIEGVNVSNNHIYDFGNEGFKDTLAVLKSNNIAYFGEGNQWVTEAKGIKFGFLGYQGWSASTSLLNKIKSDISELKSKVDVVVINLHWGVERAYTPNDVQKKIAHFAIDSGADLIIGHHPHVIQGIEKYNNRFICYSLANFCFGGNSNPSDKDTFIFQTDFKFSNSKLTQIGIKAIPCSISSVPSYNDYRPTPMTGQKKSDLLSKLNGYSMGLGFNVNDSFNYIDIK